ncbi:MAG: hypothetical protein NVSMB22_23130 [Chloroflexota bacterium]
MAVIGKILLAAVLAWTTSVALWLAPAVRSSPPTITFNVFHNANPPNHGAPQLPVRRVALHIDAPVPSPTAQPRLPVPVLNAYTTVANYPAPPIQARAAILVDLHTGHVLYEKNPDERLPIASTTKIMTAALALDRSRLNDVVRVSHRAATIGQSTMALAEGERVTVRQLLYGMLLNSGNDAAIALAEHVAGTEERFAAQMNALARSLNMWNSHFVTAHGLDTPGHYSSARDLAIIARYAMRDPEFRRIVSSPNYHIWPAKHHAEHWLASVNRVMFWYPGIDGIKPGDTDRAGLCQVVSVHRDGRHLIAVLLNTPTLVLDIRNLLNYGLRDFRWVQAPAYWDVPTNSVSGGSPDTGWAYYFGAGHYIRGAFLHYFMTHGGLDTLGYPRTEALTENGRFVQYFQGGELAYDATHQSVYPVDLGLSFAHRYAGESISRSRRVRVATMFLDAYKHFGGAGVLGIPVTGLVSQSATRAQFYEYGELVLSAGRPMLAPLGDAQLRVQHWLPAAGAADAFPWSFAATFGVPTHRVAPPARTTTKKVHYVRRLQNHRALRRLVRARRKKGH